MIKYIPILFDGGEKPQNIPVKNGKDAKVNPAAMTVEEQTKNRVKKILSMFGGEGNETHESTDTLLEVRSTIGYNLQCFARKKFSKARSTNNPDLPMIVLAFVFVVDTWINLFLQKKNDQQEAIVQGTSRKMYVSFKYRPYYGADYVVKGTKEFEFNEKQQDYTLRGFIEYSLGLFEEESYYTSIDSSEIELGKKDNVVIKCFTVEENINGVTKTQLAKFSKWSSLIYSGFKKNFKFTLLKSDSRKTFLSPEPFAEKIHIPALKQKPTNQRISESPGAVLPSEQKDDKISKFDTKNDLRFLQDEESQTSPNKHMDSLNQMKVPLVSEKPFSDLKLIKFLGRGTHGQVYKGFYKKHVGVAIKEIPSHRVNTGEIAQEISVLKKLNHETLISFFGVSSTQSHVYLVMDLVEGQILFKILFDDYHQRFTIGHDVTMAMVYLHARDIVHRDVKSGNVVVDYKTKRAKVCDSGLAKDFNSDAILETVGYVGCIDPRPYTPPEVYLFIKQSPKRSDVWSLGCTLLELFTGEFVWDIRKPREIDELLKQVFKARRLPPRLYMSSTFSTPALESCFNYNDEERAESYQVHQALTQEENFQEYRQEIKRKYERSIRRV
ncbi:hypothetical protein QAD02_014075 [Eretmocerus hayati]|uniref:Uncharacterized protein n=1 Tax=Eretmocerus hayati TaxID=131215 RepID=A0ACC2P5A5_9HYME|nr:hypothetical protein QAD02_014075 [Eretmocerus hayati]